MIGRLLDTPFVRRTLALARAEVLHVTRDRTTMVQLIMMPLLQLLVLSNAATFAVRETPMWVVDYDRSSVSRGLVSRLGASGYFRVEGASPSPALANDAMLRGRVTLVVTIPSHFAETLVRTGTDGVHLDVNSEKGAASGIVQSYAAQIVAAYARELQMERPSTAEAGGQGRPASGRIVTVMRSWNNPTLSYKHFMVPGILVALVTIIGTLVTAQNIAREREMGTIEQLNVTPITRMEFIVAKLLPFWVIALFDFLLGLLVARLVFDIPLHGSMLLLLAAVGVYLVVALAIGLLISTIVETQQQAMFVTFFLLMIYLLMGGLFTPIDSMPPWVQLLSELNPIRHFATIVRGILIKGAGLREMTRPLGLLVLSAAGILTLAVHRYQKRTA